MMKALLLFLILCDVFSGSGTVAKTLEFFIGAVEVKWDYLNPANQEPPSTERRVYSQRYLKCVYTEFTDSTFSVQKTKPPWAGLQGPTIRTLVNDRVIVHFKNFAPRPLSISPIGVPYWKQSEGAGYEDRSSAQERGDDAVQSGAGYKYVWDVHPSSGPAATDPECLTYSYSSQVDAVRDFNSGLIGALLICKSGVLTEERGRKEPEFVLLFAVFDEGKSWYKETGRAERTRKPGGEQFHTINGYANSTLPGLKLCLTAPQVSWHLMGLGSSPEIHTIQFQGHGVRVAEHRRVVVEMAPMTFTTALMKPYAVGRFLISCGIHAQRHAGMSALFSVENCVESNDLPEKRNLQPGEGGGRGEEEEEEEEEEDYHGDDFISIVLRPDGPPSVLRSGGRGAPKIWVHYIAAEEVTWSYSPQGERSQQQVYKKVAYVEYTDRTFTARKSQASSLIGPELRGEVNDQFQIVFKNMAARPFNLYPSGLSSVQPLKRTDKQVDLRSLEVPPGEVMMYLWKVTPDDAPTEADPRCLTRLYHGTLDPERDMASGLVGPLIICKSQSLDKRGKVVMSDREKHLMFSVFDENKSWYVEENLKKLSKDPDSNLMYSVNGLMNNSLQFKMCVGDVMLWHVASVGMRSDFLSVYFTGNPFEKDKSYGTVLTLFPMTGDTVTTEMETEGEWEISALDPALKTRGMSVRYSVFNCERGLPLADSEDYEYDFEDYVEQNFPGPRGFGAKNRTVAVRLCRKLPANGTQGGAEAGPGRDRVVCRRTLVQVERAEDMASLERGGIPQDVLNRLDDDASPDPPGRQRRGAGGQNTTQSEPGVGTGGERAEGTPGGGGPSPDLAEALNVTSESALSDNEVLRDPRGCTRDPLPDPSLNRSLPLSPGSGDYDDYRDDDANNTAAEPSLHPDVRSPESQFRSYYVAAEEVTWDYGIEGNNPRETRRGGVKYLPAYRKVVYRAYHDREFRNPVRRGELDEHLGIMGPVLKAEVDDVLTVVFKNLATRPYSLHLHGVYDRTTEGAAPRGGGPEGPEGPGDPVPPGLERVYNWRITKRQGPSAKDFDCKAGAYYSTVDMEKDVNSGLIGPLLICRPGTLRPRFLLQPGVQDLFLLFTIFDETKSWYLDDNIRTFCRPPCQARVDDPWFQTSNRFAAINGYVAETLPGLVVAQHQTSRWHLMNVGGRREFHAVHFHGIPFSVGKDQEHRMGIFNLYPGVFGSVEMRPGTVGTWLVECSIGEHQISGMRARLLVYNPQCVQPLGMQSGWIEDDQITESDHHGHWEARLARLHLSGSINAWIGDGPDSWIQVDLLRPMVVHGIQTQGAKTSLGLREMFTVIFSVSYSWDLRAWRRYKGNSSESEYKFNGNMDGHRIKENIFSPPIVARYVRIHPVTHGNRPALRFELLGCDLNSCSLPLGMQRRLIPDSHVTASSFLQNWRLSWTPDLARLNLEGRANAWRPMTNNPHEWLQVDFGAVKRITAVLTQGARSVLKPMAVTEFTLAVSDDGRTWTPVTWPGTKQEKMFEGSAEHEEEKLNVLEPPLFTRLIRIHPKGWLNDIALRVEFLGCSTQQRL